MSLTCKEPKLRFPEFSGEWRQKKLEEEICESGYGPRFNAEDYNNIGNVKTIRGTDISLDGEILYNQVPLAQLDENFIKNHLLEDGDLVMITTADCGLTGVFRKQNINYIPSAYAVKLRLKNTSSPFYFKYLFQTNITKNQVNKFIRKATVANLPGSDILKFTFLIPSKPEQEKIASFLTVVDAKIEQLTCKEKLLEKYKKSAMQKLFSQELRFTCNDGSEYPEWEEKKLGEVGEIVAGGTPDTLKQEYWNGEIQWFTPTEIKDKYISSSNRTITKLGLKKSSAKLLPIGTLLLSSRATVGEISIALQECTTNQGFQSIIVNEKNYNEFIYYWIVKNKKEFLKRSSGSTFLEINKTEISKIFINLPSLPEQTKIADFLSAIDEKCLHVKAQLAQTQQFKKALLQQMFV